MTKPGLFVLSLTIQFLIDNVHGAASDIQLDAKAQSTHRIDSLNLLSYTLLLILTVLTIWLFKHRRLSFIHETGLAVIYGLIVGAIIRYSGSTSQVLNMQVFVDESKYNSSLPPDTLSLYMPKPSANKNLTFQYVFRNEIDDVKENEIDLKATFDPEIFFNIILPPIIFYAGYSLKRKYFFRNLGAILTYAIIGTTVSSFVVGALMYGCVQLMPARLANSFTFLDTLYFGALISATDPLTVLAIFNDLNVDVNLYALVFGESVLNDAVAIVLSGSIQHYGKRYQLGTGGFEVKAFLQAVGDFCGIFMLSLLIGAVMGCLRGAMSFALAIRNTRSEVRQAMLTTTSLIVIITVIIQGGATMNLLRWFNIPIGTDEETEAISQNGAPSGNTTPRNDWNEPFGPPERPRANDKAFLAKIWGSFDSKYMKPLLTHSRPTLLETLPVCCTPVARFLTTTEQMTQETPNLKSLDSDSDLCIEGNDFSSSSRLNSRVSLKD
ncbi:unnamed protein product [Ceutorhynchus assimilis]|uniref:Cation/H+ exchanger transmembrane domain-containing protein n=1 Tax=Ceutorhynchus assimilis TaxID=467358 RepID=A0A9N9MDB5_9CUCU|nr:unnamed protein product [Ceutorhynchus assimilis]